MLFWARLGSLNALETLASAPFWKKWLGHEVPSADTIGRVYDALEADALRQAIHHVYERVKRNKALGGIGGLGVAIIDGHESHASYRRCCGGCLQRTLQRRDSEQVQYYHRQVTLLLLAEAPAARPCGCCWTSSRSSRASRRWRRQCACPSGFWRRTRGRLMWCWPMPFTPRPI